MLQCDHCLLEIAETKAVHDEIKGQKKVFCCHGCKGVYRLINEEGLEEFYDLRGSSWIPGPPVDISIEPSSFNEVSRQTGDEIETDIMLYGIRCASCIWLIEKILRRTTGITYAKVNYATHRARIRWNQKKTGIKEILLRIKSIGYTPEPFTAKAHEEHLKKEQRDLLVRFGTAAFFSMQLMLYSVALYAGYFQGMGPGTKIFFQLISLLVTTPVLFYSGMPLIKGSVRGLKNLSFNMDVLIVIGASSAYFYSIYQILIAGEVYFDTAAMIITLILLGRYIESGAKGRAYEVVTRLLSLSPKEARVLRRGNVSDKNILNRDFTTVQVSSIHEGEYVQISPGERISFDGTVLEGSSEVDESMLTGESRPVSKVSGSEVFCGTQNLYGSFIFQVKRTGDDTVLAQIIKVVEDAQSRRAPVQALVDRVVGVFVPAVLFLSMGTGMTWSYFGGDMTEALMNAVSVLVIACPCALGLATPLAILIGTNRGASKGILIKGGDIIERAIKINTIIFDKTGTITEGRQGVLSYRGIGITDKEALFLASSLERLSEHSISRAIIDIDKDMQPFNVSGFAAYPGRGIKGKIEGKEALIGSRGFIESEGISGSINDALSAEQLSWVESQEHSGATVVYLSFNKKLSGIFVISDAVRKEARAAVDSLKKMRHDVIIITGDSTQAAIAAAAEVDLHKDKVIAQRLPVEKAEAIREMQKEGRKVVMIGDGINDAPALIQADVGIAMGRATDIALESADMVLMKNDLRLVPDAILLSKKIYTIIRQNLFWAFIYNIVALPLAVTGILHPIVAAISMTFSSLSVVGNSVRIKRA
jgi:Cu2+-exporting ATPase